MRYTKDIKISFVEFLEASKEIQETGKWLNNVLEEYYQILNKASKEAIVSGNLNEALEVYLEYVNKLRGIANMAGNKFAHLCKAYLSEVDKKSRYLYDGVSENIVRDFSQMEYNKLLRFINNPFYYFDNLTDNFTDWITGIQINFGKFDITRVNANIHKCHKRILDYNDATQRTIDDIFNAVGNVDELYGSHGGNLTSGYFASIYDIFNDLKCILKKMCKIVDPRSGKFRADIMHLELSDLFIEVQYKLDEIIQIDESGVDITIEEIQSFTENELNVNFFTDYTIPFTCFVEEMDWEDQVWITAFNLVDIGTTNIYDRFKVPPTVETNDVYKYLMMKKELAEIISQTADNQLMIDEYSEPYRRAEEILSFFKRGGDVPARFEKYKILIEGLYEIIETIGKGIGIGIDLAEIIVPMFANYLENEKVLNSITCGISDGSLMSVAADELLRQYQSKYIYAAEEFIEYVVSEVLSDGISDAVDVTLELLSGSSKLSLNLKVVELAFDVAGELTGIGAAADERLNFMCLYSMNSELQNAYHENFMRVFNGDDSEEAINALKSSFNMLKTIYIREYECMSRCAASEQDFDKKNYYDYLANQLKNTYMDSTDNGYISFDEYMSRG